MIVNSKPTPASEAAWRLRVLLADYERRHTVDGYPPDELASEQPQPETHELPAIDIVELSNRHLREGRLVEQGDLAEQIGAFTLELIEAATAPPPAPMRVEITRRAGKIAAMMASILYGTGFADYAITNGVRLEVVTDDLTNIAVVLDERTWPYIEHQLDDEQMAVDAVNWYRTRRHDPVANFQRDSLVAYADEWVTRALQARPVMEKAGPEVAARHAHESLMAAIERYTTAQYALAANVEDDPSLVCAIQSEADCAACLSHFISGGHQESIERVMTASMRLHPNHPLEPPIVERCPFCQVPTELGCDCG